jgi:murein DD-endopeptidase MepM/ murein hydrolase activator NlpD
MATIANTEVKKMNRNSSKRSTGMTKRGYLILLGLCSLAVAAVIIVAALGANTDPDDGGQVVVPPIVFVSPVASGTIGTDFTLNTLAWNETLQQYQAHKAIDFMAPAGTHVLAVYGGTVESVVTTTMGGTTIVIKHNNELKTVYKSLDSDVFVTVGQNVTKGEAIGKVANTLAYEAADGPHLHLEVMLNGKLVNPHDYFADDDK